MKLFKHIILTIGIVFGLGLAFMPATVSAAGSIDPCTIDSNSPLCYHGPTLMESFKTIVNTLLYVLGAIAVVMIIFAGITYVTSGGDAAAVTKAKNTILYSVVGLVVAVLAYAIVNFVLGIFK
jgi:hypothetical protein